ncbi:MAG: hypothetical protein ACP5G5_04065 [Thermoplasmata archaeon]
MILAIPDPDIKEADFFHLRREIEQTIICADKLSFHIFFIKSLRVGFESEERGFENFLNSFRNIYPVNYELSDKIKFSGVELFFTRDPMFPLDPGIDVLSFIANSIETRKSGFFSIYLERSPIKFGNFKRYMVRRELQKKKLTVSERKIADAVIKKLSMPLFRVRIFTDNPPVLRVSRDLLTGQGLDVKGKRIYMSPLEISYFIHYPMSNRERRRPW